MDLFKFIPNPSDPTILENGDVINNALSIMWVERYRQPGEFEIKTTLGSDLLDFLPIDTLISHKDTLEVMIVENHEIKENADSDSTVSITGRSFTSFLEQRIVGTNQVRASSTVTEYSISAGYTWNQAVTLINDHIVDTTDSDDELGNVVAETSIPGTGTSVARTFKRINVLSALSDLLKIDDLGIRTNRRSTFSGGDNTQTVYEIYKGNDKTATVIFSYKERDIIGADYLRSNKNYKSSALVLGRYINIIVDGTETKYNRKMMLVDANDIDGNYTTVPVGGTLTTVINKMTARGNEALMAQNKITITRADIAPILRYRYGIDYKLGDLVLLEGNFGAKTVMRVIEHAEIEDENGRSSHPTLSLPNT